MIQFESCGKCEGGYIYSTDRTQVSKCDCLKKYQAKVLLDLKKEKANIENFDLTLADYKGKDELDNLLKLKYYTDHITDKLATGSSLYFYGKNGTQKSTMSKVILLEALKKGLTGKFLLMNSLMGTICDSFNEHKEERTFLETCDLLVIDDCFSAKKVTLYKNSRDYQMSFLDAFFRKRLEQNKKNIIFTSNVTIDEIESNGFSYDIMNLLKREISAKKGNLTFSDVYVQDENDINIKSLWD